MPRQTDGSDGGGARDEFGFEPDEAPSEEVDGTLVDETTYLQTVRVKGEQ